MKTKMISVSAEQVEELYNGNVDVTLQRVGRHWFANWDAPVTVYRRYFYAADGSRVGTIEEAAWEVEVEYFAGELVANVPHLIQPEQH